MNSKVLIVEDDGIFATALKKKLENWGYVPKIVFTGQDALNEMEVVDPDLIIMDIYLKGKLNGINTAELIDDKFEMPIIYYSSSDDEKLSKSLKNHRNRDYVSKSSSDEHLKKTIENNLKKNNNIHNQDLSYVKKEKIDQKGKNSENLRLKINSNPPKAEYINEISLKPEIKIKKDFDSISKIKKMKLEISSNTDNFESEEIKIPPTQADDVTFKKNKDFIALEKSITNYSKTHAQIEQTLLSMYERFLKVSDIASNQHEEIERLKKIEKEHMSQIYEQKVKIEMMKDQKQKLEDKLNNYKEKHQKFLSEMDKLKSNLNRLTSILNDSN